jgi:imidazolonepropionase-like amidohydrolase
MKKRDFLKGAGSIALAASAGAIPMIPARARAQASTVTLITNVRVFDGKSDALTDATSVLIEGNKINNIAPNLDAPQDAVRIDGGGRVLMPGLTDMHVHLMWNLGPMELIGARPDYVAATALKEAEATLMRGYTSIRDTAGGIQGVARAIDEGLYPGPRVQGSHGGLTMTAGHADYRNRNIAIDKFGGPPETEVERTRARAQCRWRPGCSCGVSRQPSGKGPTS